MRLILVYIVVGSLLACADREDVPTRDGEAPIIDELAPDTTLPDTLLPDTVMARDTAVARASSL